MPKSSPSPRRVGDRRPVMALLELLGQRWCLRILWELRDGPLTSRALRTAAGEISPSVLQARIDELREAGIVELGEGGYALSDLGRELLEAFAPLYRFADRWAVAVAGRGGAATGAGKAPGGRTRPAAAKAAGTPGKAPRPSRAGRP